MKPKIIVMQIFYYSIVKKIYKSVLPFCDHLVGICFSLVFFIITRRFFKIYVIVL
jgi:hypothetical protein